MIDRIYRISFSERISTPTGVLGYFSIYFSFSYFPFIQKKNTKRFHLLILFHFLFMKVPKISSPFSLLNSKSKNKKVLCHCLLNRELSKRFLYLLKQNSKKILPFSFSNATPKIFIVLFSFNQ